MPNNILITPGSASIQFSGSAANTIRLQVETSGSIAFYGNSGSLFGISDSLSGSLMSVNDISGLPILEVFSDDRVVMGSFNRNTLVVTGSRVGIDKAVPTADLDVSGSVLITGSLSVSGSGLAVTGPIFMQSGSFNMTDGVSRFTASVGGGNVILDAINAQLRFRVNGGGYAFNGGSLYPETTNARDIGVEGNIWRAGYFVNLFTSGSLISTGSIQSLAGFTGSLQGTSSWAESSSVAISSSFATTASYALSSTALLSKAGSITNTTFTGNPRRAPVNFTTPFSSTNYAIVISGEDSRAWSIEGKVVGGFTASANSNVGLAGTTYWIATAYGES